MERMVAHLLEVHNGALPVWLSPVQVRVLPIVDDAAAAAESIRQRLTAIRLRAEVDQRNETLAARVRDAQHDRVPFVAVVGRREAADGTVAVRLRDGSQLDPMPVDQFVALATDAATPAA